MNEIGSTESDGPQPVDFVRIPPKPSVSKAKAAGVLGFGCFVLFSIILAVILAVVYLSQNMPDFAKNLKLPSVFGGATDVESIEPIKNVLEDTAAAFKADSIRKSTESSDILLVQKAEALMRGFELAAGGDSGSLDKWFDIDRFNARVLKVVTSQGKSAGKGWEGAEEYLKPNDWMQKATFHNIVPSELENHYRIYGFSSDDSNTRYVETIWWVVEEDDNFKIYDWMPLDYCISESEFLGFYLADSNLTEMFFNYLSLTNQHYENNDLPNARRTLRSASANRLRPHWRGVGNLMVSTWWTLLGQRNTAIEHLKQIGSVGFQPPGIDFALASEYYEVGDFPKMLQYAQKYEDAIGPSPYTFSLKAKALRELGRTDEAREMIRLGLHFDVLQKELLVLFSECIAPDESDLLANLLAEIEWKAGSVAYLVNRRSFSEQSLLAVNDYLVSHPDPDLVEFVQTRLLFMRGEWDELLQRYHARLTDESTDEERTVCLESVVGLAPYFESLDVVLRDRFSDQEVLDELDAVFEMDYEISANASRWLNQFVEKEPKNAKAVFLLGKLEEDIEHSTMLFRQALELESDVQIQSEIQSYLATALSGKKQFLEAIDLDPSPFRVLSAVEHFFENQDVPGLESLIKIPAVKSLEDPEIESLIRGLTFELNGEIDDAAKAFLPVVLSKTPDEVEYRIRQQICRFWVNHDRWLDIKQMGSRPPDTWYRSLIVELKKQRPIDWARLDKVNRELALTFRSGNNSEWFFNQLDCAENLNSPRIDSLVADVLNAKTAEVVIDDISQIRGLRLATKYKDQLVDIVDNVASRQISTPARILSLEMCDKFPVEEVVRWLKMPNFANELFEVAELRTPMFQPHNYSKLKEHLVWDLDFYQPTTVAIVWCDQVVSLDRERIRMAIKELDNEWKDWTINELPSKTSQSTWVISSPTGGAIWIAAGSAPLLQGDTLTNHTQLDDSEIELLLKPWVAGGVSPLFNLTLEPDQTSQLYLLLRKLTGDRATIAYHSMDSRLERFASSTIEGRVQSPVYLWFDEIEEEDSEADDFKKLRSAFAEKREKDSALKQAIQEFRSGQRKSFEVLVGLEAGMAKEELWLTVTEITARSYGYEIVGKSQSDSLLVPPLRKDSLGNIYASSILDWK